MELPSKRLSCSQSIIQFEGDSLHYEPDEDPLLTQPCRRLSSHIEDARTLNLIQMIKEHEAYLETCKETNKINEAEKVYAKIVILKKELAMSKKKELEVRHQEERERLDQMQIAEMEELVLFWDIRIQNYKSEAQTHIENNLEKYKNDHQELKEGLEVSLSQKIVVNPQRMIYQKIINTLVKKRDFEEAKHFKNLCVGMEREDMERTIETRDTKMKTAANQLMQKQLNELSHTKARVTTGLTNLNRMKKEECEKLRLKFQHMQRQVARAQAQELAKLESLLKTFVPIEKRRYTTNVKNFNDGHKTRSPINLRVDERVQTYSYCSPPQVNSKRKVDAVSKAKVLAYRRSLEGIPSKSPQRSVALPSATMSNIQIMENKGWRYKKEHLQTQCK